MRIVFDRALPADIPALNELLSALFSQESEFNANEAAQRKGLSAIIKNPDCGVILVARSGQDILGMVNLLFTMSTALGERVAILEDMIITPAARGADIGGALLDHAILFARNSGVKRITLLTDRDNHTAQHFYSQHGVKESTMIPFRLAIE